MDALEFKFTKNGFNRLFPFYILIDESLTIISYGSSFEKICPEISTNVPFVDYFKIERPYLEHPTFEYLSTNNEKLTVIQSSQSEVSFRGQFEVLENQLLFVGSPWFNSMHQVVEKKMTLHDFALHDPLIDLLHVLNNQENTSKELKELLTTINNQKNKLKLANKEIHDIALFPMQNPDPLIRIDFEGNLVKRNPAAEKLLSFFHHEMEYDATSFFKYIINEIDVENDRYIFETKSGAVDYSFVCKSLKEEKYINIYGRDITEQKKNRAELERLSLVASSNENGIVFTQPDGIIFWCNDAYTNLTGYPKEFIIGKTPIEIGICDLTNKEDFPKMLTPFYNGEPFEVELIHGRKDGSHFWSRTKGQPIFDQEGKVKQYFAMLEDISLKKRYDESIEIEKSKYQSIIANMNLGLLEVDLNDVITLSNNSFTEISGYTAEELRGKKAAELLMSDESKAVLKSKNKIRRNLGITDSYEVEVFNKQGEKRYWLISGAPNYDLNGNVVGSIGIHLDITKKKELEEQREFLVESLAKSNKELEEYASIVSHDLKSPLRSIHALISWIKEDNDKDFNPQTKQYLGMVENKVEKMDHLIEGILTYAKIDKADVSLENINTQEIVQNIINIIHIPSHISVNIKNILPVIKADRFRIQQLFQNIIGNAVNYVDKPTGIIDVDYQELSKEHRFSITDNGPGIAKENQEKIFKIFQSLETSDKSTGLGLSIVKKIVDLYHGKIWIESKVGQGTTFYFTLPKN